MYWLFHSHSGSGLRGPMTCFQNTCESIFLVRHTEDYMYSLQDEQKKQRAVSASTETLKHNSKLDFSERAA